MAGYSPFFSSDRDYFWGEKKFPSPSSTPSPRLAEYRLEGAIPQRPSTRIQFRNSSDNCSSYPIPPRGLSFSPRYTSDGAYGTANMGHFSPLPLSPEPRQEPPTRTTHAHPRRISTSKPERPQTARPSSAQAKRPSPEPKARATETDAKRHNIPPGYSLKNWDPAEEPIILLGSVFDANSLGKWIYDWTVYHHGPGKPISDMAGELWLLLIQLAGKIKRGDVARGPLITGDKQTTVSEVREVMKDLDILENNRRLSTLDRLRKSKQYHGPPDGNPTQHPYTSSRLHRTLKHLIPPSWAIKTLLLATLPTLVAATDPNSNSPSQFSPQDIIIQITAAIALSAGIVLPPLRSNDTAVSTNRIYWIAVYSVWGVSFAGLLLLELRRLKNWLQRRLLAGMVLFSGLNLLGSLAQGSLDGAAAWAPLSLTVSLVLVPVVIEYLGPREAARLVLTSEVPESRR